LAFGRFVVEVDLAQVCRDGQPVALRPKTFALLVHLADRAGSVVSKQELMHAIWPGLVVTDDSLTQAISELRGALGDRSQQLIKTISKRGYLLDATVQPAPADELPPAVAPPAAPVRRRRRPVAAALVGIAVAAGTGYALLQIRATSPIEIGIALAESRSLAVMPFTDLSEPPAPHLAQAVDTDLSTDLGRLADTRVMPRSAAAPLGTSANVDLKRVGRELDVRHVVTGTVKRDGEHVQVTAQLMRADTGALVWAERFDYPSAADWIARRDVSARIANVLDLRLRDAALQRSREAVPNNAAVDHWMRGAYIMSRLKTHADLLQARTEFEAALALQPDSSHALAGLASTYVEAVVNRWTHERKATLQTAERLARQALAIDPRNQVAMRVLGASLMFDGRIGEAMAVTRQHLALNPNDAHATSNLAAQYYFAGRWEESLKQVELAMRLNPLDRRHVSDCHVMAATALIPLHRYDEAIERSRLVLDGPRAGGLYLVASAEAWRGNLDAARAHVAEILERKPDTTIASLRASRGSKEPAYLDGMAHFYEGLRRAGMPEGAAEIR
jgi:DNA-binding winged helix-turn-helix (wHTH) protein/TolB-like protein/Tfp pilus assembly protein PilF